MNDHKQLIEDIEQKYIEVIALLLNYRVHIKHIKRIIILKSIHSINSNGSNDNDNNSASDIERDSDKDEIIHQKYKNTALIITQNQNKRFSQQQIIAEILSQMPFAHISHSNNM